MTPGNFEFLFLPRIKAPFSCSRGHPKAAAGWDLLNFSRKSAAAKTTITSLFRSCEPEVLKFLSTSEVSSCEVGVAVQQLQLCGCENLPTSSCSLVSARATEGCLDAL